MQLHSDIKPISWVKNNARQMIESVSESGNPMIITQHGEARAVVVSVREYDEMQQSLALLRMLADSSIDVEAGRLRDADEVFADLRTAGEWSLPLRPRAIFAALFPTLPSEKARNRRQSSWTTLCGRETVFVNCPAEAVFLRNCSGSMC